MMGVKMFRRLKNSKYDWGINIPACFPTSITQLCYKGLLVSFSSRRTPMMV